VHASMRISSGYQGIIDLLALTLNALQRTVYILSYRIQVGRVRCHNIIAAWRLRCGLLAMFSRFALLRNAGVTWV